MEPENLITCQEIKFEHGYPVLRKAFRHLAKTPSRFEIWMDVARKGTVHLLFQYSDGTIGQEADYLLAGGGRDHFALDVKPGWEGSIEIVMIDHETGNERASRIVHFGGME